ncbi:hypothetical protein [Glycomyces rhizosphaerae]|uniref:Uncharacterized protein n=1 Tax=Glycomyces rhizosphaerae TaxID=2054422 RepID=A0ABV7Q295_9ACTN
MTTQLTPLATRPTRIGRITVLAAFLWSLLALPIGLWHLLDPENGPYGHENFEPTIHLPEALPGWIAPAALIAAGLLGLLIARAEPRLWPLTALYAAVFGLLLTTVSPMAFAGYMAAFAIPLAVLAGPVLLARGTTARVITGAAIAAILIALISTGVVDPAMFSGFVTNFGDALADQWAYLLTQVWTVAGGAIWTALTLQHLLMRGDGTAERTWLAPERAAKWGRTASWIAFACALPYGLTRMTWLTPWPWFGGPIGDEIDPAIRVWGLLLGFAALSGGVLCLGMTQRWGTRWPFWMPVVKGRPVPPMIAIVPASMMAAMFTFMAVPFAVLGFRQDAVELVWAFPFYIWGPALGAATLAYAIRRGVVLR